MNLIAKLIIRTRENLRGQTMTEYALILAAVAVVVFVTYQVLGQDINAKITTLSTTLSAS